MESRERFGAAREALLRRIGLHSVGPEPRILEAFRRVPRHEFVPSVEQSSSYQDRALSIDHGQTISQPSMIAVMLAALDVQPEERVLEVGAGSGYAAALLAELAGQVYGVEIVPELAEGASRRLAALGYDNAHIFLGNGRAGLARFAPFSKILVSAGSAEVPAALPEQLARGGRIAIPVGGREAQTLLVGDKDFEGNMRWRESVACIFVPLVGAGSDEAR
jgi:protein-L-isoaspartate(D-aspartate) O-methyltransferase